MSLQLLLYTIQSVCKVRLNSFPVAFSAPLDRTHFTKLNFFILCSMRVVCQDVLRTSGRALSTTEVLINGRN